jgi:excisionase family DNA binding protein
LKFTPLESPAIYGGDDKKIIFILERVGVKMQVKAPSFLTGFTCHFFGILLEHMLFFEQEGFMPLIKKDTVLTTKQAIKYLKISKPTFLKYCREGKIKAIKAGKGWKVLQSELDRFLRGEVS